MVDNPIIVNGPTFDSILRCKTCYTMLDGRKFEWTYKGNLFRFCGDRCRSNFMERCGQMEHIPNKELKFKVGDKVRVKRPEEINGISFSFTYSAFDKAVEKRLGEERIVTIKEVMIKANASYDYMVEEINGTGFFELFLEKYEPIYSRYSILDL